MAKSKVVPAELLAEVVAKGMEEKKGLEIVIMDLRKLKASVADFFVVCHGTSDKHVQSLADSVEEMTLKTLKDKPLHTEGKENGEWVLLDYVDVVVHIFLEDKRDYYGIEELWGDAEFKKVATV